MALVRRAGGKIEAADPKHLLDAWREQYDFQKHHHHQGAHRSTLGEELVRTLAKSLSAKKIAYAMTGLAGAWLVSHFAGFRIVTAFVGEALSSRVLDELGFRADDAGANLWLVQPNDEAVFRHQEDRDGVACVHPLQVYLDLQGPSRAGQRGGGAGSKGLLAVREQMTTKPTTVTGYPSSQTALVRSTCLYVATKLGDLLDDIVVVGGLAPTLLIDQDHLPPGAERHVGTLDLDVGLSLAILDDRRYEEIVARLTRAGFSPDKNEAGNATRQRWRVAVGATAYVSVDFLIPPSTATDKGGTLRHLDKDLAAVITPGLGLASRDREKVNLKGTTIAGEAAERDLWVCGPGAFVVLKALAFDGRGETRTPTTSST